MSESRINGTSMVRDPSRELSGRDLVGLVESRLDRRRFQDQHWNGTFWEYLDLCVQNPGAVRNSYQRLYDAIQSYGSEKYRLFKKDCVRYHFFSDRSTTGRTASTGWTSR